MSDTSRELGWWVASDGKWYPPGPDTTGTTVTQTEVREPRRTPASARPLPRVWAGGKLPTASGNHRRPVAPIPACRRSRSTGRSRSGYSSSWRSTSAGARPRSPWPAWPWTTSPTVVCTVAGSSQGTAITYATLQEGNGQNGSSEVIAATLPWTRTISASGLVTIYHVSADVGAGGSSVTCSITDNGSLVSEKTAIGAFRSASCNWGG